MCNNQEAKPAEGGNLWQNVMIVILLIAVCVATGFAVWWVAQQMADLSVWLHSAGSP
ncbi:MAG: hypothetical protein WC400_03120 [Patescibacteria group bacterium]|jgi:flagellar basal body-associated protein FliL